MDEMDVTADNFTDISLFKIVICKSKLSEVKEHNLFSLQTVRFIHVVNYKEIEAVFLYFQ